MKNRKRAIITAVFTAVIWFSFFITDYILEKNEKSPIFCVIYEKCDDGGSVRYLGIGYIVEKNLDQDEYWDNGNKFFEWSIRPWFWE